MERGLEQWTVRSAGTWASGVRGASQYSIDVMALLGFDITGHRSQMVDEALLNEADLVLCMETGHVEALRFEFPAHAHKVYLLSEMDNQRFDIHDPYGEPVEMYQRMAMQLSGLIDAGLDRIVELARENERRRQHS